MPTPIRHAIQPRATLRPLALFALAALGAAAPLSAQSTLDPSAKWAWSANAGWINGAPAAGGGIEVTDAFLQGTAYAANFGWIRFGDGSPDNGYAYSNATGPDTGVNHDGAGRLSGYAWAANVGWIHFGWAAPDDPLAPRIDLGSGAFSGFAYGANIGWINLGTGRLTAARILRPDTDGDGIADAWEYRHFGDLSTASATSNQDGDPASDLEEYRADTDPADAGQYFRVVDFTFDGTHTFATVQFTTQSSRRYRLESTPSLDPGLVQWDPEANLDDFAPDDGPTTTRVLQWSGHTQRIARAVALLPLP